MDTFMREQIAIKKAEFKRPSLLDIDYENETRGMDIFTRLTRANEGESDNGLSDDELVRYIYPNNKRRSETIDRKRLCNAFW